MADEEPEVEEGFGTRLFEAVKGYIDKRLHAELQHYEIENSRLKFQLENIQRMMTPRIRMRGPYEKGAVYDKADIVFWHGAVWYCRAATNVEPEAGQTEFWEQWNKGGG